MWNVKSARVYIAAAIAVGVAVLGCGDRAPANNLVVVGGLVTVNGVPLKSGTISFVSDNESLATAKGNISMKGMYSLSSQGRSGVLPGKYHVAVETPDGSKYATSVEVVNDAKTKRYDLELTSK